VFTLYYFSQLTAGYWQNGRLAVRVSGQLVGKSCLSVCLLYVWPYLRNGSSDQLRFWHAAEGRQARECVLCVARSACISTPGEARQRREYNPRAARQARRTSAECIMLYVLTVYPAVSWAPCGLAHEFTGRQHGIPVLATSVCLSVRPSVTCWHWVKTMQARITKSSPTDSPRTLVFGIKNSSRNSKGFTPSEGSKWEWGMKNSQFWANKSPYLRNGAR